MESVMAKQRKKFSQRSKRYPLGLQRDAVERMKHCKDITVLAQELGVSRGALYLWKRKFQGLPSYREAFAASAGVLAGRREGEAVARTASQGRGVGRGVGTAEHRSRFFQKCLAKSRGVTPAARRQWRDAIYEEISGWAQSQGEIGIQRLCALVQVSRASFYREWEQKAPGEAETALRDAVQRMAMANRGYGYRRIARLIKDAGFAGGRGESPSDHANR
jgi:hypothetical protein